MLLPSLTRTALAAALALGAVPAAVHGQGPSAPTGANPDPLAIAREEYAARRQALAARLSDTAVVIVAFGAREPAHDYEKYPQAASFHWLTGFREPDAALVMIKRGAALTGTLFVPPSDPAREVWTGARAGVAGARTTTGLAARSNAELRAVLDSLAANGLPMAVVGDLRGRDVLTADEQEIARLRRAQPALRVVPATTLTEQLRARKSATELARIRRAVDVTVTAQREAMRLMEPGLNEFEVQALVEYTFRRQGADGPSFATIVGSGPNATTLHYNADDRPMRDGEVVVMDIGASYAGYAADVTRTVPVNGRFSREQRAIYQVVRDAQAAAERAATVGAAWAGAEAAARRSVAEGLTRLGLIEAADATYDCAPAPAGQTTPRQCPQVGLYFMHGLGHGIGLEVHDPAQFYSGGTIQPGDAFTLEPGVYVRERLLDIVPDTPRNATLKASIRDAVRRYANIGVRIEDDYIATANGVEWISRAPREIDEVEAAMRAPWRGPGPRDARGVEGYRPR
ncbi:MAG: aminopeptidase P N-terminal domain-containing protein [Gemmatirosa sp.]